MGFLLRTAFSLFVTLLVVAPDQVAVHFDTPRFKAVKSELAAERPADQLRLAVVEWLEEGRSAAAIERGAKHFTSGLTE